MCQPARCAVRLRRIRPRTSYLPTRHHHHLLLMSSNSSPAYLIFFFSLFSPSHLSTTQTEQALYVDQRDRVMTDFFNNRQVVLHTRDGFPVMAPEALKNKKYVLLFVGAQWSPPCRAFTPKLKAFYERHHTAHNFEIIFVSRDGQEQAMETFHYCQHGPWFRLPFRTAKSMAPVLQMNYSFTSLPTLLVFENATVDGRPRRLIARCGVEMVLSDPNAEGFPWEGADLNVPKVRCMPLITMPLVLVVLIFVGLAVNLFYTFS